MEILRRDDLRGLKGLDHVRGLGFGEEIGHPVEVLHGHPLHVVFVHALRLRNGVDGCELACGETGVSASVSVAGTIGL